MRGVALVALAAIGCGGKSTAEGSVGGVSLSSVESAWWGGPFIVLSDQAYECLDMAWVERTYDEEEIPTSGDAVALQITFNGDEVVAGLYDLAGDAAVNATFLVVDGNSFTFDESVAGSVSIDEIKGNGRLIGSYDVEFGGGSVKGDLDVEWCTNLKD